MFKNIKTDENSIEFIMKNNDELSRELDNPLCNALRRIIISEIPVYAIEIVSIEYNNSILSDETFAHRMGLIPTIVLSEENIENEVIKLNVKYDKNNTDEYGLCNIYTKSLIYDTSKIYINPNILLIQLKENEEISMDCFLSKNIAYEHSKWSCVSGCSMIKTDESFKFKYETLGHKKCPEIFIEAINILQEKFKNLKF